MRVVQFHAPRDKEGAFFVEGVGGRPFLYGKALDAFKAAQLNVGVAKEDLTGLHGLRVRGYNDTKHGLSEDLAVAHGGWRSTAHKRYDRFAFKDVLRISAVLAGADPGGATEGEGERSASAPARRLTRATAADSCRPPASPAPSTVLLPEGWEEALMDRGGRQSVVLRGPRGELVDSRAEAWAIHEARESGGVQHPDELAVDSFEVDGFGEEAIVEAH